MGRKGTIAILAAAVLLLGIWSWKGSLFPAWTQEADTPKPKAGYDAPAFSLKGLDELDYSVGGERQKPLLLNFWASWCGPCELEAPDLQSLYKKYGDRMDIYGINSTSYDRERDARSFVKEQGLTFPVPMDRDGDVTSLYKISNFPTTLLISREGKVLERITGVKPRQEWEEKLSRLLSENE